MNRDDDPELWDLLGRAAEPKVSPFFARNVVREIRGMAQEVGRRSWLSIRRLLPITSVAVALMVVFLFQVRTSVDSVGDSGAELMANVDPQDYELVADLSDGLAPDEINPLEESILR